MVKKKRTWFEIISPRIFGNIKVGETLSYDSKSIIGRIITVNARDLTNNFKKSHINIKLIINKVSENKVETSIYGYVVQRQYLQRFLQKKMSKVELITDTQTSDKKKVRMKLISAINGRIQATKKKLIRNVMEKELIKLVNNMDLDNLVLMCLMNKLQITLSKKIHKIHPLKFVEVRRIDLLK